MASAFSREDEDETAHEREGRFSDESSDEEDEEILRRPGARRRARDDSDGSDAEAGKGKRRAADNASDEEEEEEDADADADADARPRGGRKPEFYSIEDGHTLRSVADITDPTKALARQERQRKALGELLQSTPDATVAIQHAPVGSMEYRFNVAKPARRGGRASADANGGAAEQVGTRGSPVGVFVGRRLTALGAGWCAVRTAATGQVGGPDGPARHPVAASQAAAGQQPGPWWPRPWWWPWAPVIKPRTRV